MLMLFSRILGALSNRLAGLSRNRDRRRPGNEYLRYIDCLTTVRKLLEYHRPENLCDIGANSGHWSLVLGRLTPSLAHVALFEPQKKHLAELEAMVLPGVKKMVFPCALGDREGAMQIRGSSASASLLEAARDQHRYFPGSVDSTEVEEVRVRTLDSVYAEGHLPYPDTVKIDVQGFELNVLKGAETVLQKARCLVIELSFREFYVGQPPLSELMRILEQHGFVMVAHGFEWLSNDSPSELLQMDGIFLKRSKTG